MTTTDKFDVFKEITIGGISKKRLFERLSEAGIQFNQYAKILFEHPNFLPTANAENVELVKVSLPVLGLEDSCSLQDFSNRASELGLKLCPLYLAAFLRLEYLNQPEGRYLTVASLQPDKDENFPNGFYLRNYENALWLRGYRADGFSGWPENNEFVFMM
jgi:hypothetical protein